MVFSLPEFSRVMDQISEELWIILPKSFRADVIQLPMSPHPVSLLEDHEKI